MKNEKQRLRWAARRGMLELDFILQTFIDDHFEKLTLEEQVQFKALLECEDVDLFAWFMGYAQPEVDFRDLIVKIKGCHESRA